MEISDIVKIFKVEFSLQTLQAKHAFVPPLQVGGEEMHIVGQLLKQRSRHLAAEHGDVQIRVLHSQVMDDRHCHGDVAQGGEPYNEELLHAKPIRCSKITKKGIINAFFEINAA